MKNSYLFAWNPKNWPFNELPQHIEEIKNTGKSEVIWSIASYKTVKVGDRGFIMKLGKGVKGIFASGIIISAPKLLPHWGGKKLAQRVGIELDVLLDYTKDEILLLSLIKDSISEHQHWSPQASGIRIDPAVASNLEGLWQDFVSDRFLNNESSFLEQVLLEGYAKQLTRTIYERNKEARERCILKYGYDCAICGFNFKKVYGAVGENYTHVHHLIPLSHTKAEYQVDPIKDLRPVCANCHAMLHRRNPPYSLNEIAEMMKYFVSSL